MKSTLHYRMFALAVVVALLHLFACNTNKKEEKDVAASTASSEQVTPKTNPGINEVKSEAPDAVTKTEQGYAFPSEDQHLAQSPINIITKNANKAGNEKISFSFHSNITAAENLGHTIQIDFGEESTCEVNGKNYTTRQFHFHTPSEHLIDGITYPLEMHIVNVLKDSNKAATPSYLVVSVLFKMGSENAFIKEFLKSIPEKEEEKKELNVGQAKLDDLFSQIPKDQLNSCYSYEGSLTTPPYSESVHWVILHHVVEASEEQILSIEKLEGNNARHVQALNSRKVKIQ